MTIPAAWIGEAYNPVPESENRIHSDEVARAYGFRGALVPGVIVSAYLLHPAAAAWGREWAERGQAHVAVRSPVYDGETFRVELKNAGATAYEATLIDARGAACATAEASLPNAAPAPPRRRGDRLLTRDSPRPEASRRVMQDLREKGLGAMPARWSDAAELTTYLRDAHAQAPIYRDERLANPGFVLGLTNWVLARNMRMGPWLHLETWSQHHRAIPWTSELVVEAAVVDLFEKKGHQFADLDVAVYTKDGDDAVASIRFRSIYQLRETRAAQTEGAPRRP
jgi:hypothetical protein